MTHDSPALWRDVEFRKSSFSGSNGGDCVEIGRDETVFGIRDSKNADGPVLAVDGTRGQAFLAAVRRIG